MANQHEVFDPTEYLALQDIALWSATFEREEDYQPEMHSGKMTVQSRRGAQAQVLSATLEGEKSADLLRVLVELGLRVVVPSEGDEVESKVLHTIEATFAVYYEITKMPSEDNLAEFAKFHCIHNAWPFWRQHVFDTLKRASLPVVQVPLFAGRKVRSGEPIKASKKKSRQSD